MMRLDTHTSGCPLVFTILILLLVAHGDFQSRTLGQNLCQWTIWEHFDKDQWRWWWRGLDLTRPHYYMGSPKIIYINCTGIRTFADSRIDNLSIYQGWDHDIFKWTHTYSQITHRWMVWWRNYFNLFQGILYFFFYLSYLILQILWL